METLYKNTNIVVRMQHNRGHVFGQLEKHGTGNGTGTRNVTRTETGCEWKMGREWYAFPLWVSIDTVITHHSTALWHLLIQPSQMVDRHLQWNRHLDCWRFYACEISWCNSCKGCITARMMQAKVRSDTQQPFNYGDTIAYLIPCHKQHIWRQP